ncbi:hypothetical protein HK102_005864 [Quaeritorhiza haematococci]|nr:hypothetical protein HK102_005864 [Quaeritorhiza haematococci]
MLIILVLTRARQDEQQQTSSPHVPDEDEEDTDLDSLSEHPTITPEAYLHSCLDTIYAAPCCVRPPPPQVELEKFLQKIRSRVESIIDDKFDEDAWRRDFITEWNSQQISNPGAFAKTKPEWRDFMLSDDSFLRISGDLNSGGVFLGNYGVHGRQGEESLVGTAPTLVTLHERNVRDFFDVIPFKLPTGSGFLHPEYLPELIRKRLDKRLRRHLATLIRNPGILVVFGKPAKEALGKAVKKMGLRLQPFEFWTHGSMNKTGSIVLDEHGRIVHMTNPFSSASQPQMQSSERDSALPPPRTTAPRPSPVQRDQGQGGPYPQHQQMMMVGHPRVPMTTGIMTGATAAPNGKGAGTNRKRKASDPAAKKITAAKRAKANGAVAASAAASSSAESSNDA